MTASVQLMDSSRHQNHDHVVNSDPMRRVDTIHRLMQLLGNDWPQVRTRPTEWWLQAVLCAAPLSSTVSFSPVELSQKPSDQLKLAPC